MYNQMRNLIGAVKDKMDNAMTNYGLHKTENHENTHEMGSTTPELSSSILYAIYNFNFI
jgi:hypothetical protein